MQTIFYVAYPDMVDTLTFLRDGDDGRNFKPGKKPNNPAVFWSHNYKEEGVFDMDTLFLDPMAAAIASTLLFQALDD